MRKPHAGRNLAIFWLVVIGVPILIVTGCTAFLITHLGVDAFPTMTP